MSLQPHKLTINGAEIHYVEQGTGEPVLFVHGGLGDWRTWRQQLEPFSSRYRAISYSRRAHHPNAWPADYEYAALNVHVEDMAALLEALEAAPAHIVANSYGGYIALVLALRSPHLVRTLSLAEPPVYPLLRTLPGGEASFNEFMQGAWLPAREAFDNGDMEGGVRLFLSGAVGPGSYEAMSDRAREGMMRDAPELAVAARTPFDVQMPPFTCEDASRIIAPTLLLRGTKSPHQYTSINAELVRCMPDAREALIPNAAHVLNVQNPEAHDKVVLDFLEHHKSS